MRFDPSSGRPSESIATCLHGIGGVLAHLDELAAIYLPNASSYRRIVSGAFAPFPERGDSTCEPNSASVGAT